MFSSSVPDLLILTAVPQEARCLCAALPELRGSALSAGDSAPWRGDFEGRQIEVLVSGLGAQRARKALESYEALAGTSQPSRVLITGFAGGLAERLGVGDWAVGASLQTPLGGIPLTIPGEFGAAVQPPGRILSDGRFLHHPDEKGDWARRGFLAVDMESAGWGPTLARWGSATVWAKVITDTVAQRMPDIEGWLKDRPAPWKWALRPVDAVRLARLWIQMSHAANRLAMDAPRLIRAALAVH